MGSCDGNAGPPIALTIVCGFRFPETCSRLLFPEIAHGDGETGTIALTECLRSGTQIAGLSVRKWAFRDIVRVTAAKDTFAPIWDAATDGDPHKAGIQRGMVSDHSFIVLRRPEPENEGRWGIYSVNEERWLGILYKSEMAAAEAVTELRAFYGQRRPR